MRRPAGLAGRDRALEPECAGAPCDHARVTAPVVAAVRAGLPELDERPTDRCAARISQDATREDMPLSDSRASRCRDRIRLERPTPGRCARPTRSNCWPRRSGSQEADGQHKDSREQNSTCQALTDVCTLPRRRRDPGATSCRSAIPGRGTSTRRSYTRVDAHELRGAIKRLRWVGGRPGVRRRCLRARSRAGRCS
jgi:hypothetical protein